MGWETFNVEMAVGGNISDGQCNFTCTITNQILTAAGLQYSPSAANPPGPGSITTIFNSTGLSIALNADGTYHLSDVTLTSKFNIPPKGNWTGGNYNTLSNCRYNPTSGKVGGVFQDIGIDAGDPDCSWDASGTETPAGDKAHKKAAS